MSPLPHHQPKQLSLGSLEAEIVGILWTLGPATAQDIHRHILSDPARELTYASVMTVLGRLEKKEWLACDRRGRAFVWTPRLSRHDVHLLRTHEHLKKFLTVGSPDVVAAFADSLDTASIEQLEAIAQRLKAVREDREEPCT
ncbi:MAG: BlaI/MecI/CopY family transcriptional regulator [Elainellaceae cyanobacterium]